MTDYRTLTGLANPARVGTLELSVRVDDESRRILVDLVDQRTGESVRAIPTKEERLLAARLRALQGVMLDTVA